MRQTAKKSFFGILAIFVFAFELYSAVPNNITMLDGQQYNLPEMVTGLKNEQDTSLKLFGVVPFKNVQVDVVPNINIIPCGKAVGVKIDVDGIMVLGFSEVRTAEGKKVCPAKDAGLKAGDIIIRMNGKETPTVEDLTLMAENGGGEALQIDYRRGQEEKSTELYPILSTEDNLYKLGAWVRDTTSGIGTLTFIIPETGEFGALGHPVTDADTSNIITVGSGNILPANIVGVEKGLRGSPGELKGVILKGDSYGNIVQNNEFGIYGYADNLETSMQPMPIAMRNEIQEGPATILSNIQGDTVEEYSIEIQKVFSNSYDNKGMVLKVTDQRLLQTTGGIVQGMSGCPILQNGKIVGAVTHVFVNDPTRGYGVFIELMLAKAGELGEN